MKTGLASDLLRLPIILPYAQLVVATNVATIPIRYLVLDKSLTLSLKLMATPANPRSIPIIINALTRSCLCLARVMSTDITGMVAHTRAATPLGI
ncbi:hypothetical protein D3C86_1611780 [compost metagenome]